MFLEYKHMIQQCVDIFVLGFINYMFMGKGLTNYTNLFSLNKFKRNDDITLNYCLTNL